MVKHVRNKITIVYKVVLPCVGDEVLWEIVSNNKTKAKNNMRDIIGLATELVQIRNFY